MYNLPAVTSAELNALVIALTRRRNVNLLGDNRKKWRCKIRTRVSAFIAANLVPRDLAWRLKSSVSEKCLRRLGLWRLVAVQVKSRLPVLQPQTRGRWQNRVRHQSIQSRQATMRSATTPIVLSASFPCVESIDEEVIQYLAAESACAPCNVSVFKDLSDKVRIIKQDVRTQLADWAVSNNVPKSTVSDLLVRLSALLPGTGLPKTAATLLNMR
jgi:hypothetical protein